MSTHSVAEAKSQLSDLIDRAIGGEAIVITRHGHAVVELKPVAKQAPRPITDTDIEWLDSQRVGKRAPRKNAGALVSKMRDEDDSK